MYHFEVNKMTVFSKVLSGMKLLQKSFSVYREQNVSMIVGSFYMVYKVQACCLTTCTFYTYI